jgi:hypothetical protein
VGTGRPARTLVLSRRGKHVPSVTGVRRLLRQGWRLIGCDFCRETISFHLRVDTTEIANSRGPAVRPITVARGFRHPEGTSFARLRIVVPRRGFAVFDCHLPVDDNWIRSAVLARGEALGSNIARGDDSILRCSSHLHSLVDDCLCSDGKQQESRTRISSPRDLIPLVGTAELIVDVKGVLTTLRRLFAFSQVSERNGDFSPTTTPAVG